MEILEVLKKRHSVRKFKDKEIEKEKIQLILEAANSAPSAGNLQAREIFLVRNEQKKQELAEAALGQDFIAETPIVLVFFANPQRSASKYGQRGEELYCIQDATLSAAYAWLQTIELDLGTCWVGAFDDETVKEVLGVKEDWQPIVILPIGYPDEKPHSTPRIHLNDLVHEV
jgi:nitroreductase